ncbi:MAG TPA: copper ion binding protein [Pseudogracilibacillus sp.]|nr:copper ion binding protein [Pseudogracilibacillus sp.]
MSEIIKVEGMGCNHCVETIESTVGSLQGVTSVKADLDNAQVTVELTEADVLDKVKEIIEDQGYDVAG